MQYGFDFRPRILAALCWFAAFLILYTRVIPSFGQNTPEKAPSRPGLGIGFLWTDQSRPVASKLAGANDFVDVIFGEGRLEVFVGVKAPVRVACISLALAKNEARPFPGVRETIEILRRAGIDPGRVIIAYNPERAPGTPTEEVDDLVGSVIKAARLAREYGALLLVGPGLMEMGKREHLYPELARHCQIWLIQSQRLQLDGLTRKTVPPSEYREKVKRIVEQLKRGNPAIRIYVQLVTTSERGKRVIPAEELVAYARAIEDLVDAVRLYGASAELLTRFMDQLRPPLPAAAGNDAGSLVPGSAPDTGNR